MNHYKINRIFAYSLSLSLFAVLLSFVIEYGFSITPCSLCKWQRWGFISALIISLIGIFSEQKNVLLGGLLLLFSAIFFLSLYHGLVQFGLLSDPCLVPKITSTDDFWEAINAPLPCSKISFSIFGIPPSLLNAFFSFAFIMFFAREILNPRRNRVYRI